jgi:hypothetical protein
MEELQKEKFAVRMDAMNDGPYGWSAVLKGETIVYFWIDRYHSIPEI